MSAEINEADGAEAGFTLVELIVALALLALMFTAIAGVMRFAANATARSTEAGEAAAIHAANQFIRSTISRARLLYQVTDPGQPPRLQFVGSPTSLTFVANMPGRTTLAGLHVVTLRFEANEKNEIRGMLGVKLNIYRLKNLGGPTTPLRPLVRNVRSVTFSYFGAMIRGQKPAWHSAWKDAKRLPDIVSVDVEFPTESRNVWPETKIQTFVR